MGLFCFNENGFINFQLDDVKAHKMTTAHNITKKFMESRDKLNEIDIRLWEDRRYLRRCEQDDSCYHDIEEAEYNVKLGEKLYADETAIYWALLEQINQKIEALDWAVELAHSESQRLRALWELLDAEMWDQRLRHAIAQRDIYTQALIEPLHDNYIPSVFE
jgi:hypothetical protein